ncbi:DUF3307 domain-containing protein [Aestuariivivens sp. NBU2969]|uniref:DUF3307 domain-containing protein n=1 Tax=Aestuariivivens sp. NBU2969 TaxID=2873267 RepID=UPI001CC17E4B|nr:DUF3307 domain-containing protein [Aestuariivivens sp. NBU2969]
MILIKLLLAHILGDFFLQPKSWVKDKEKRGLKSSKLYLHVLIHIVLSSLLLWDITQWPIILTIGLSHLIVDALKLTLQKKKTKRIWFFMDQLIHVVIILICFFAITYKGIEISVQLTEKSLLIAVCLLFLTIPTAIIMKTIFIKWNIEKLKKGSKSLADAGKYIGILERILVFIFIITNHWEAVGFLITAKSVFRFGDLKESKNRQLTEYILIGTLISFGIAIVVGIICSAII